MTVACLPPPSTPPLPTPLASDDGVGIAGNANELVYYLGVHGVREILLAGVSGSQHVLCRLVGCEGRLAMHPLRCRARVVALPQCDFAANMQGSGFSCRNKPLTSTEPTGLTGLYSVVQLLGAQ